MSIKDWIIIGIIVFVVLIFVAAYGRVKYEEGFAIGSMVTFYWIEHNTSCTNAGQIYMMVSEAHPEDAIYICVKGPDGKFKIPDKSKRLTLNNR